MPFPLPRDPYFRKEIVWIWIQDAKDRLKLEGVESASKSWKIANEIYLSLPAGLGCNQIEGALSKLRVKLDSETDTNYESHL